MSNPCISNNGEHVGGIVSYLSTLRDFVQHYAIERACCVWDGPNGSVRRRSIYKDYKEGRRPKSKNRFYEWGQESNSAYQQLGLLKILRCLPVHQFSVADCEADDVIAALVYHYAQLEECNVVIMSTDKDYLQLVGEHVAVYNPVKHKFVTTQKVLEEYSIHPTNFALARSIIGDDSDNIGGIRGMGFKTLVKFFPQLKEPGVTLNNLYESAKTNKKSKIVLNLVQEYGMIERNYRLMQLGLPVLTKAQTEEIKTVLESRAEGDRATLRMYLLEYGLNYNCDNLYDAFLKLLVPHAKGPNNDGSSPKC